ncbi:glycosyl hydrolase [Siansivirga zeaxanthinifaciens CC-SAMT-1]|uniref:Glycosyl hydrolase n=1 Tax=Siansivirga zeaxanthinifaciens CC-SAMT-1 TaxID=1454006 RepID=A0A0C5WE00_9FLAO|nr:glycosyl hydrolase [Siansivirga zeaxanthinifaciens CC-SAMT-1]
MSCHVNKQEHKIQKTDRDFISIFDGKTLKNWKGDPGYWHVENGNLVGIVTPETLLKKNSFIIWQGGQPENFELKLEYRISEAGNSGVNYRSELLDTIPYALRGYQCDIDGKQRYTGQNYEEKKRTTLAYRGEKVLINPQNNPDSTGNLRANIKNNCWLIRDEIESLGAPHSLKAKIKNNDWNQVHLIINGNKLQHYINGTLMSEVTDADTINRSLKGYIGVQVHVGPPMKVEYRNIKLKLL